jgi:hypothetical protein
MSINGSNPMLTNENQDPLIHIIPQFKELSVGLYRPNKKCGIGATNENCIADFKDSGDTFNLVKRNNYNKMIDENDKYPNTFLGKNFNIVPIPLNIGMYNENWKNLFSHIRDLIIKGNIKQKHNIFITSHQHNLQNMFFKFRKTGTEKKYGFRNCTCIKISGGNNITMNVIHSQDTGRDKSKYEYLKIGDIKQFLDFVPALDPLLETCDIYIIRHGEAIHNLVDVKNELINKWKKFGVRGITNHEYSQKITPGNIEMLNALGDSEKRGKLGNITKAINAVSGVNKPKLNALLTTQGVDQAKALYNTLINQKIINNGNQNIYISSPMDRTIQTLIYATSDDGEGFPFLKQQFLTMYEKRFPITYNELKSSSSDFQNNKMLHSVIGGIRRKSRRNMKRKSKKNKRSKKARKTRKHKKVRRTRRK